MFECSGYPQDVIEQMQAAGISKANAEKVLCDAGVILLSRGMCPICGAEKLTSEFKVESRTITAGVKCWNCDLHYTTVVSFPPSLRPVSPEDREVTAAAVLDAILEEEFEGAPITEHAPAPEWAQSIPAGEIDAEFEQADAGLDEALDLVQAGAAGQEPGQHQCVYCAAFTGYDNPHFDDCPAALLLRRAGRKVQIVGDAPTEDPSTQP